MSNGGKALRTSACIQGSRYTAYNSNQTCGYPAEATPSGECPAVPPPYGFIGTDIFNLSDIYDNPPIVYTAVSMVQFGGIDQTSLTFTVSYLACPTQLQFVLIVKPFVSTCKLQACTILVYDLQKSEQSALYSHAHSLMHKKVFELARELWDASVPEQTSSCILTSQWKFPTCR